VILLADAFTNKTSLEIADMAIPLAAVAVCSLVSMLIWYVWSKHVSEDAAAHEKLDQHDTWLTKIETTIEVSGSHQRVS
jgi:hypothetical protein